MSDCKHEKCLISECRDCCYCGRELIPFIEPYSRMRPTLQGLMSMLRTYSEIDYGQPAYPLSTAEAKLLLEALNE